LLAPLPPFGKAETRMTVVVGKDVAFIRHPGSLRSFDQAGDFASLGFLAVDADRRRPNSPATGILAERLRPCPLFEGRSIVNRTTNC
jgi:hypothetical protein